ncbi:MAG: glycosyltransferase family 4 protein [Pseudomonadota bacterium]
MTEAVFAIPGDKDRRTGGFIYEATVLRWLNDMGCQTAHLELPASFPDPDTPDMAAALAALQAVPPHCPIILDGLVFGAIDPEGLKDVPAPVIAMIHHPLGLETGLDARRALFLLRNETAALRYAAHVIVPSPETARVLAQDFEVAAEKITIALPGFDQQRVKRTPSKPPLILSVGLLAARKGHDVLLDALAQIRGLSWQAEIVGKVHDSEVASALKSQSKALAIEGRVLFAGELDRRQLDDRFRSASIFALATRYEGYGMVLGEAMTFGLPIVSTTAGAVPDTVDDAGILVPVDDAQAFAMALARLLENPAEAEHFAKRAEEKSANLPVWKDTAQVFAKTIRRLRQIA